MGLTPEKKQELPVEMPVQPELVDPTEQKRIAEKTGEKLKKLDVGIGQ